MKSVKEIMKVVSDVVDLMDFAEGIDIHLEASISISEIMVRDPYYCETIARWNWYHEHNPPYDYCHLEDLITKVEDWLADVIPYRVKTIHDPKMHGHEQAQEVVR